MIDPLHHYLDSDGIDVGLTILKQPENDRLETNNS